MNKFQLTDIYIYPIKSLGGIRIDSSIIEEKGLKYDRRWMLIDREGIFITQRKHTKLSMLQVSIESDKIYVQHKTDQKLVTSFFINEHTEEKVAVSIWDNAAMGSEVNESVNKWFSQYLEFEVKLVKLPEDEKIMVDKRYAPNGEIVSFSDGYPCLIVGQSSLDGLNRKLAEPVNMNRFRPNFVFSGGEPHIEDSFKTFNLAGITFTAVKPCARCVLITIDQGTGLKGQEPLRTLAGYRTVNQKIMFGQNLIHSGTGIIKTGDELEVKNWK